MSPHEGESSSMIATSGAPTVPIALPLSAPRVAIGRISATATVSPGMWPALRQRLSGMMYHARQPPAHSSETGISPDGGRYRRETGDGGTVGFGVHPLLARQHGSLPLQHARGGPRQREPDHC